MHTEHGYTSQSQYKIGSMHGPHGLNWLKTRGFHLQCFKVADLRERERKRELRNFP